MNIQEINQHEASEKLRNGALIIAALAGALHIIGDARQEDVMKRLRKLKSRPAGKGFTILMDSDARINKYVKEVPAIAWDIFDTATDPVILILPEGIQIAREALGADGTIAVRMVTTPEERAIVQAVNGPVACTALLSQNGGIAPTLADASADALQEVDYVLTLPTAKKGFSTKKIPIISLQLDGGVTILRE